MRSIEVTLLLFLSLLPSSPGAAGLDPIPLRSRALEGRLGADGWFADRPLVTFSIDGAWMVLADRFGRSVSAFDLEGGELWTVPIPAGREVRALALDPAGRLYLAPSGTDRIWIYDRPAAAPLETALPGGAIGAGEIELYRSGDRVALGSNESRIRFWLDPQGAAVGADTMTSADVWLRAYAPRGAVWTYRSGDRRIRGGENGKRSIALGAPLSTRAALAVNEDGIVWVYESVTGRLDGYTPNGFPHRSYLIDPTIEDPAGLWIDPTGGFWIADRSRGRFVRYVP